MTQPQEENLGGGTPFGTFNYSDDTDSVRSIDIQYKIQGGGWTPSRTAPVRDGVAADTPGYSNVIQTRLSIDGGATWVTGNEMQFVTNADGNTNEYANTTVTDS